MTSGDGSFREWFTHHPVLGLALVVVVLAVAVDVGRGAVATLSTHKAVHAASPVHVKGKGGSQHQGGRKHGASTPSVTHRHQTGQGTPSRVPGASAPPPAAAASWAASSPAVMTHGVVHQVPLSINSSCGADVTQPLEAWLAKVPDGTPYRPSIVAFPRGGCYAMASGISLTDRRWIVLRGNGSTIRATTTTTDPVVGIHRGCGIDVLSFHLVGRDPVAGHWDSHLYGEHGVAYLGVGDPAVCPAGPPSIIADNTIRNVYGDGIKLGMSLCHAGCFRATYHVLVQGNIDYGSGREGVGPDDAHDVTIQDNVFVVVGHDFISGELYKRWGATDISIVHNLFGQRGCGSGRCGGYYFVQFHGHGAISNILVEDNKVTGGTLLSGFTSYTGTPVAGVKFVGNVAAKPMVSPAMVMLSNAADVVIARNQEPIGPGNRFLVFLSSCRNVQVVSNTVIGLRPHNVVRLKRGHSVGIVTSGNKT